MKALDAVAPLRRAAVQRIAHIAIIAPSGPPDRGLLDTGKAILNGRFGPLSFFEAPNIGDRLGYLAGDDDDRIAGMRWAFEHETATHVWFARGGFGTTRIVGRAPWREWAATGKTLLGYSDATAFLLAFAAAGGAAVHCPMIATDIAHGGSDRSWQSMSRILFEGIDDDFEFAGELIQGPAPCRSPGASREIQGESVHGPILPGNIAVLAALAGTKCFPDGRGRLVCLEEVKEEPYRIDRNLTQLKDAGLFEGAAGVVFGSMTDCIPEDPAKSFALDEMLSRFAREIRVPVVIGFPFGHGGVNSTLPVGRELNIRRGRERGSLHASVSAV